METTKISGALAIDRLEASAAIEVDGAYVTYARMEPTNAQDLLSAMMLAVRENADAPEYLLPLYREQEYSVRDGLLCLQDIEGEDFTIRVLGAQAIDALPIGNVWGEDADFDREDWRHDVHEGNTNLGYWEWVTHRRQYERDYQADLAANTGEVPKKGES